MSNGVVNFNFLALFAFRDIRGSQIYTRGHTPLGRPLAQKYFYPKRYFTISNCIFNFNILALVVTEILGGVPNLS